MLKLHQTIARGEAMPESIHFDDKRFDTLFNRLRARHQFDSLTDNEKSEWLRFAAARLNGTVAGARSLKDAKESAETLMKTANAKDMEILNDLKSYYNTLSTHTDNVSPGQFEIFI